MPCRGIPERSRMPHSNCPTTEIWFALTAVVFIVATAWFLVLAPSPLAQYLSLKFDALDAPSRGAISLVR
jgi:hypothetical protein